jgi:hypothetical protein
MQAGRDFLTYLKSIFTYFDNHRIKNFGKLSLPEEDS